MVLRKIEAMNSPDPHAAFRLPPRRAQRQLALLCAAALALSGCLAGARRQPDLHKLFAVTRSREGKRPVIFVPGLLGTELANEKTGEVVWPAFFRSSDDELDLPLGPDFLERRDALVPTEAIGETRLLKLLPKVKVFQEFFEAMSRYGGYRLADMDDPPPSGDRDTLYTFAYDWRRDQVESARLLIRRIEELKRKLGHPGLRFNIVTVSGGGTLARYAAMYGDADLPANSAAPIPTWAGAEHINKIFMFGPPNEGTADMLSILLKGYSFNHGLHRRVKVIKKLTREDALSSPAVFQLLPHAGTVAFYDKDLKPLPLDIYDPAVWRKYGWSLACEPEYRRRFAGRKLKVRTPGHDELAGLASQHALDELDGYLNAVLARTRKYHEALNAQGDAKPPVSYYVFAGDCEETLQAFVIVRDAKRGRYETLTRPRELRGPDGRRITREEVKRVMFGPGDGRVTRRSLMAETFGGKRPAAHSPYVTTLPIVHSFLICIVHGYIQDSANVQDNVLTFLANDAVR
jgi:hypothetical protein